MLPFNHTLYNRHLKDIKDNSSVTKVSSAVQSFITSIIKLYAKLKQLNDISFGSSQDLVNASDNTLNKRDFICYFDGFRSFWARLKPLAAKWIAYRKSWKKALGLCRLFSIIRCHLYSAILSPGVIYNSSPIFDAVTNTF